jgi:hypothetical protein
VTFGPREEFARRRHEARQVFRAVAVDAQTDANARRDATEAFVAVFSDPEWHKAVPQRVQRFLLDGGVPEGVDMHDERVKRALEVVMMGPITGGKR